MEKDRNSNRRTSTKGLFVERKTLFIEKATIKTFVAIFVLILI